MPYWNTPKNAPVNVDSNTLLNGASQRRIEFYEIEPAIVLDVILDKNHKYFQNLPQHTLNPSQWQPDLNGKPAKSQDLDYTWIGKALVRLYYSQQMAEKEDLVWATPLESNISEYPLLNEIVGVVSYLGKYYYTRKINMFNLPNMNADFSIEPSIGGYTPAPDAPVLGNRELKLDNNSKTDTYKPFQGPLSKTAPNGGQGYEGVLGRYFYINKNIRALKRREGDLILESRFGQSIRFAAYDDERKNDIGHSSYKDYFNQINYQIDGTPLQTGGGNPMILIRNRQRDAKPDNPDEKNVGGYMLEDINEDGTSVHTTSGLTISKFKPTCYKKMWGTGEEQSGFDGTTLFKYPQLSGDQMIVNSDRIIISSKANETFHYSKKRYAIVTDDEYTVDAHNQIVLNTNTKTVLNSPVIYLGEYDQTGEPVLLGQTSVNWLYELCNWLLEHTHWYKHSHPDAGQANPDKTQTPVQVERLKILRDNLQALLSRRVFVTGGGYAPGQDGESLG